MAVVRSASPMAVVERPLTRSLTPGTDRCDRCRSRAYVKVVLVNGDLLFCGHHASEHERAYLRLAARVVDERSFIPT